MPLESSERVSLLIDKKEFFGWSEFELHDQLDSISTCTFKAPFEPERRDFRNAFRPFTYKPIEVRINGELRFAGRMVGVSPALEAESRTVEVTAYAHAGALNDCMVPGADFPEGGCEFKGVHLQAIATVLARLYGITAEVRDDDGPAFDKVRLEIDKKIWAFLTELAQQRNLVLSNTPDGNLLIWRSVSSKPVVALNVGEPPLGKISAEFSPQEYYSEITCFSKTTRKKRGGRWTAKNRFLKKVLRSMSFHAEDTDSAGGPEAAQTKLGRMFANMAAFSVENLPTWRDPDGALWRPNTTVLVTAPEVMIYQPSKLIVRGVTLRQNANELSASLDLVLPGAFAGEQPEQLPWGVDEPDESAA